jgi:CDGSH-type Zn-finger protein/uncharacterized Fe-S cluster protein YjdI
MCCYLFAAYSLKRDERELRDQERAAIARWRRAILDVARDEMVHLALVSNLLVSIGSAPHFGRPNFPVAPGYHPAGVVVSLAPFDRATLDHFIYLERPEGVALPDGAGFTPNTYRRGTVAGRLVPTAQDYATVGHLYRGIRKGFDSLARALGDSALFVGEPKQQVGPDLLPMAGLATVRSLADAERAIDTIVRQGEGSTAREGEVSHYAHFRAIARDYEALLAENPSFAPGRSVARSPVMRRPPEPAGKVWVSAEPAATLLDLANASYALMLRALSALFSPVAVEAEARFALSELTTQTMRVMGPLAERLTTLPAADDAAGTTAGMTFTMSRSLSAPPDARGLRGIAEATAAVVAGVREHLGGDAPLERSAASLDELAAKLGSLSERATTHVASAAPPSTPAKPAAPPPASASPGVEVARGKSLTVLFEAKRCIHSRHCVLDAPAVFLANTPGEWIFPDAASVETLVGVAHACPSGAIRYQRHDGGPEESAPPVNVARVRENGPLAVNAAIELAGHGAMLRATLCRCGQSKNKPYCDGSHVAAGFTATGEPPTGTTDPLGQRGGALVVTPRKDGPLLVRGSLEVCAGTGRVIGRVAQAAFCRCGGSKNKPYCDGTHAKNGFQAEGA